MKFFSDLLTVPPWFSRGFDFEKTVKNESNQNDSEKVEEKKNIINLVDLMKNNHNLFDISSDTAKLDNNSISENETKLIQEISIEDHEIVDSIPQVHFYMYKLQFKNNVKGF